MNATAPQMKTYPTGTLAFLDTFAGMIPCKVIKILIDGANGKIVGHDELEIELTKSIGAYRKGEILTESASNVVPRPHRIKRQFDYRINNLYRYSDKTS